MSKIFIDIGHGAPGKNPGATYGSRKEATDVIKLAKAVGTLLTAQGVTIKYSRGDNEDPALTARTTAANNWGADYFVSFHRNACSPNVAQGFEAWIYSKAATGGDAYTKAKAIVDAVCAATGFKNRGVKKGAPNYTDYAVNSQTKMTSVLLECGFVDSDSDNKIFDAKFDAMALAIAKALCTNVGVTYKTATATTTAVKTSTTTTKTTSTTKTATAKKTTTEIAKEVIQGKWGNGVTRRIKLTAAGYNYSAVQTEVNKLLKK